MRGDRRATRRLDAVAISAIDTVVISAVAAVGRGSESTKPVGQSDWTHRPMRNTLLSLSVAVLVSLATSAVATAELAVVTHPVGAGLSLAGADAFVDPAAAPVVHLAAGLLADDLNRVSGRKTAVRDEPGKLGPTAILIGTIGDGGPVDGLVASGKVDAAGVRGQWETFAWQLVTDPLPGVRSALVILGSDRRGTAYGCTELSRATGVSPWSWWADVPTPRHGEVAVTAGRHVDGPPGVKYRGIFLNDEDWGLQPWAGKTFDPQLGNVGPKTYEKLYELMLRLRLNYLWPAMHPGTSEFGAVPGNAELADRWAVVMGASHCEPMLRNNVYWPKADGEWRYDTNGPNILKYWAESVAARGTFEAVWTLGIRGIHDRGMNGPPEKSARVRMLEGIFTDQRKLIDGHVTDKFGPPAECFVPYKEVLPIYDDHLKVPDDVTLMWPDDNYGYIRHLPTAAERARAGGNGIYYHLSYQGGPASYLWLESISPGLVWEELHKAYQNGVDRMWMLNVGDLKPAEVATDFYSQLAWSPDRWGPDAQDRFLRDFFTRTFGADAAGPVFDLQSAFYRLSSERKAECITTAWVDGLSAAARADLDRRYVALMQQETATAARVPADRADAYFEMVGYAARMLSATGLLYLHLDDDREQAKRWMQYIHDQTRRYNEQVAGGKWRRMMSDTMVGVSWPTEVGGRGNGKRPPKEVAPPPPDRPAGVVVDAASGIEPRPPAADPQAAAWHPVAGLGWSGRAVTTLPATAAAAVAAGPLSYAFDVPAATPADAVVRLYLLPTMRLTPDGALRVSVAIDGGPPTNLDVPGGTAKDENDRRRRDAVLSDRQTLTVPVGGLAPGRHTVHVSAVDPAVVIDQVELPPGAAVDRASR